MLFGLAFPGTEYDFWICLHFEYVYICLWVYIFFFKTVLLLIIFKYVLCLIFPSWKFYLCICWKAFYFYIYEKNFVFFGIMSLCNSLKNFSLCLFLFLAYFISIFDTPFFLFLQSLFFPLLLPWKKINFFLSFFFGFLFLVSSVLHSKMFLFCSLPLWR